jgi:chromosome segregation ATPase
VKAELDGAYGTRAQRAADVSMNPAIQKEFDDLNARNGELENQLNLLRKGHEAKDVDSVQLQNKVSALQRELKETIEEYEVMTKQSLEDEKERERLEENVDAVQRRCEELENQLNEERVKSLGSKVSSPTETTSTMVLRNEFRKMMRDTRAENLKVLKVIFSSSCADRRSDSPPGRTRRTTTAGRHHQELKERLAKLGQLGVSKTGAGDTERTGSDCLKNTFTTIMISTAIEG